MARKTVGKCSCGCGDYYYPGTLQPQSPRVDGYIDGHEPELDMTKYDEEGEVEKQG